jgi:3'-phosphoadenosine 5'-phosphosulfate (PAPS) 3'-phosphatase
MMRTQRVRHTGCAVLDLCYVACGRVDALWEIGPRPWDVAAGALIVAEPRGQVINPDDSGLISRRARSAVATASCFARCARGSRSRPEADRREAEGRGGTVTHPTLASTNPAHRRRRD